jgi:cell wall-associated NlpC family hydrolase
MAISGNQIVSEVEKFVGDSYVYGGTSPSGFDCSGLVQYVLTQLGVSGVPRTSEEQYAWATPVTKANLKPGDLVFAQFPGDNASPGHVGVYVGGGNILSAEDPALGVGYATLTSWGSNIVGYGSVPGSTPGTGDGSTGTTATNTPVAASSLGTSSVLTQASGLLKDVATVLDYIFGMFGRGQGWRTVFTLVAGLSLYGSYKCLAAAGAVPEGMIPKVVPV